MSTAICLSMDNGHRGPFLLWKVTRRTDQHPPSLYQPYGVTFHDENIVLAEGFWPFSRLHVFSGKGRSVRSIGQGAVLPFGVVVNSDGNIVTTDHSDRTVKVFDVCGEQLLAWKPAAFEWPTGIAVDERGRHYILDWSLGTVNIHEESGERLKEFRSGSADGPTYSCPAYVAVDSHKRIVVSDVFDRSVKIFDESGRLILRIESGAEKEKVLDPRGVCVDEQSNIVVADWGKSLVKLYSFDGRWIRDLLTRDDGIVNPRAIAIRGSLIAIAEQKLNESPSLKLYA